MPEEPTTGPVDIDVLERIGRRLSGNPRFERVETRPEDDRTAVVATYDTGYFPSKITRATLRISWFETDDFYAHYAERYSDGTSWECRWDRHPNEHNTRAHFHPPPDATTPGEDRDYAVDWREVLEPILESLDSRIKSFWS